MVEHKRANDAIERVHLEDTAGRDRQHVADDEV